MTGRRKAAAFVPGSTIGATEFGRLIDAHASTISKWIKAGLPFERSGTKARTDLGRAVRWVIAHYREGDKGTSAARTRKLEAEAEMKELDLAERRGKVVSVEEVTEGWKNIISASREAVMAIPGVAVQEGIVAPENEAALDAIVFDTLTALGEGK